MGQRKHSPPAADPAAIVALRQSLRLAFVASLQYLPPRQRAVLLLREVLGWPATDVAHALGTSVAAVKSALQRARATLHEIAPDADDVAEPSDKHARLLLDRYIAAFESADATALAQVLRDDLTLEFSPSSTLLRGQKALAGAIGGLGSRGEWRMVPIAANGQPSAAAYRRAADGSYRAHAIVVLGVTTRGIRRITVFEQPALFARFGLPYLSL